MLPWFSKRSLIWAASALALLGVASSPLSANSVASTSRKRRAAVRSSVTKPTVAIAPQVDPTSLRSVENYVAFLHNLQKQARILHKQSGSEEDAAREKVQAEHRVAVERRSRGEKVAPRRLTPAEINKIRDDDESGVGPLTEAWDSYLYWLRPRVFPGNKLDVTAFTRAAAKRDAMPVIPKGQAAFQANSLLNPVTITPPNWSTLGPPGYASGSVSWRVSGMTYDPNDPTHYFAAGSRGGVWESHDSGQSWVPIMDFMPMLPVSCIAVDYRDSNTIYVGTGEYDSPGPGYGILKGRWDGVKWTFVANAFGLIGSNPVHRITVDPNTSSKIFATAGNRGLLMSVDRGSNWQVVLGPSTSPAVTGSFSNVVYSSFGDHVYACADGPGGGIFQSTNGGVTWAAIPGAPSPQGRIDIAASPVRSRRGNLTVYALLANEQQVVRGHPTPNTGGAAPEPDDFDNGPWQWTNCINFPKTVPGARNIWSQSTFYNMAIACTTTNDQSIVTDNATPIQHIGQVTREVVIVALLDLHISMDGGLLWRSGVQRDIDFPYDSGVSGGIAYATHQQVPGYHTDQHALAINPKNPFEFLVGCDGGAYRISFTPHLEPGLAFSFGRLRINYQIPEPIPKPLPTPPPAPGPPNPHDYALYEGLDNIFDEYFSFNPYNSGVDFAKPLASYSIQPINNGLSIAQFYFTGHHPTNPLISLGGTQDNGTVYSYGGINTWQLVIGGDGGGCGINQFSPNIQFGSIYFQKVIDPTDEPFYPVGRTDDGWSNDLFDVSIFTGDDQAAFFSTGEMSRSNRNLFYMSTNYLYQYDERVQDWVKLAKQFSSLSTITAIETTPASIHYLYVGTGDGLLYLSTNADNDPGPDRDLVTFTEVDRQGQGNGLPVRAITGISANATNPKQLFVTVSGLGAGHVFVCDDVTVPVPLWRNITSNLPDIFTNCICVLPRNNGLELAVGTDIGVFYSTDGGATWNNVTAPFALPNVQVNKLYFEPATKFLNAGTFGRGIWHIDLTNTLFNIGGGGGGNGGPPPVVTIAPYLQAYVGSRTKLAMNIQVFQSGVVVLNKTVQLTAAGFGSTTLPGNGTYDILVSIPGFLHKRIVGQVINANIVLRPSLFNGDVIRDNAITQTDYNRALQKLGQFTSGPEDVDGDGSVTVNDLNIIQKNIGLVGDN